MKEIRLPVEVDPVSDARWARLDREIFVKLDAAPLPLANAGKKLRPVRALAWSSLGAAAAVAAIAFVVARSRESAGPRDRVRLATTDSESQFTTGESLLTVAPRSLVLVGGDDDHGIDVVLDHGRVTCVVAPRRNRPPFVVESGDVRVRVTGTRFGVTRDSRGTTVDVDHGSVEVSSQGAVVVLHDGERWQGRTTSASTSGPAPEDMAQDLVPAPPSSTNALSPWVSPPATLAPLAPSPHAGHLEQVGPRSLSPSANSPMQPWPETPTGEARPAATTGAMANSTLSPAPAIAGAPPNAGPSPQEAFESAALMERARPEEAAGIYRQLAQGGSPWAPNGLFALGRLEAERGHREDAVHLLNEYLARYPRGPNAADARDLLVRMR